MLDFNNFLNEVKMLPIFSTDANLFEIITTLLTTLCAVIGIPWGIFKIDRHNKYKETQLNIQYNRLPKNIQKIIIKYIYKDNMEKFKENCFYDYELLNFGFLLYKSDQKRLLLKVRKGVIFYKYKLWVKNGSWDYEKKWKYICNIPKDETLKKVLNSTE